MMNLGTLLKALSSGIWWKRVHKLPPGEGIIVPGDLEAWRKIIPFVWRFTNQWIFIEVDNVKPYWLYYECGSEKRKYHIALFTKYIMLRISRDDVRFLAVGTVQSAHRTLRILTEEESQLLVEANDDSQITAV